MIDDKVPNKVDEALSEKNKETQRGGGLQNFASTARWNVLTPEETPIEEPLNPRFKNARAPTIPEEDSKHIPVKRNFSRIFDIPVFRALFNAIVTFANGRPKIKKDGTHET